MKRDLQLIRKILFAMEQHEHGFAPHPLGIDGYTEAQIGHHAYLMEEAGLIEAAECTHFQSGSPTAIPTTITWDGREFLEAARNDQLWSRALKTLGNSAAGLSFEILKTWLLHEAKTALGLSQP